MANEISRKPAHLWKPGQSGNPKGRPKNSKNKITLMKQALEGELRVQLGPAMASILQIAIDKALEGDTQMIKLLLDKTLPTTKAADDEEAGREKIHITIGRLPDRPEDGPVIIQGEKG